MSWPILAAGGGLIAVAAAVLAFVFFWPSGGGGGGQVSNKDNRPQDTRPAVVKLRFPPKAGEERDVKYSWENNSDSQVQGKSHPKRSFFRFDGRIKMLAVDRNGMGTKIQITVRECKGDLDDGKGERDILSAGVMTAETFEGAFAFVHKNGDFIPSEVREPFIKFGYLRSASGSRFEDAFAIEEEKKPGDTWAIDKKLLFKGLGPVGKVAEKDVNSAQGKFLGRVNENGIEHLEFELSVLLRATAKDVSISQDITLTLRTPADYSSGPVQRRLRLENTMEASGKALSFSTKGSTVITEDVKYSTAPPKQREQTRRSFRADPIHSTASLTRYADLAPLMLSRQPVSAPTPAKSLDRAL